MLEARLERSKEARDAQISLDIQANKLEAVLLATMRSFVKELLPWRFVEEGEEPEGQGIKTVLTLLDGGVEGAWGGRCRLGWYREFVRRVSCGLNTSQGTCADRTVRETPCFLVAGYQRKNTGWNRGR